MSTAIERPGIVVGVDGSCAAQVAVDWAARDAALRDLSLTVVHIATGLETWPKMSLPAGFGEWQRNRGHQIIDEAVHIASEAARGAGQHLPIKTEMYYSATIPTLIDMSRDAEMVVVGRGGQGRAIGVLLGSVSSGVTRHAHCPVAVIHDEDPLMPYPAKAPVLVGVDGSPAAEWATEIAFDEASRRGVDLVALRAWSDAGAADYPGLNWSSMKSSEDEFLTGHLAGWQDRYPDVRIHRLVVCDQPARQLIEQSEKAQLVVVGSRGRGGIAGMLLGSVSAAVIQSARMPVIVARRP